MKNFNTHKAPQTDTTCTLSWIACIHSHTDLHQHSYSHVVRSASSAITQFGIKLMSVFISIFPNQSKNDDWIYALNKFSTFKKL